MIFNRDFHNHDYSVNYSSLSHVSKRNRANLLIKIYLWRDAVRNFASEQIRSHFCVKSDVISVCRDTCENLSYGICTKTLIANFDTLSILEKGIQSFEITSRHVNRLVHFFNKNDRIQCIQNIQVVHSILEDLVKRDLTKKKRKNFQKNPPANLSILIITYPPRWEQI